MKYIPISEVSKKYGLTEDQIRRLIGTILLNCKVDKFNALQIDEVRLEQYLLSHPPSYRTCLKETNFRI